MPFNRKFISFFILAFISLGLAHAQKYQRQEWKHWIDADHNCVNTRGEILKKRSLVQADMNKKGCSVLIGKWEDFYYPQFHTNAKKIDIDHLIPLKNAHISGGFAWDKKKKEAFANDPDNLVITDRIFNRQKGSKGIDQWLPVGKEYACKYIQRWIKVKVKYNLKILEAEQNTINTLKTDCKL